MAKTIDEQVIDEIRELALTDTQKFIDTYVDMDKLKICKRRKIGQTLQQIASAMGMPKSTIRNKCKTC